MVAMESNSANQNSRSTAFPQYANPHSLFGERTRRNIYKWYFDPNHVMLDNMESIPLDPSSSSSSKHAH